MSIESIFAGIGLWFFENFGKEIAEKSISYAKEKITRNLTFNWEKAAETYKKNLIRQHSHIRILGKSEPVPLENIFTDVYILDELTARKRYDISELKKDSPTRFHSIQEKRENGLTLLKHNKHKRLFVLGKPGAGKTTFLKYLTLRAIEGEIDYVPIFVSLKDLSDSGLELMTFFSNQFRDCQLPDERFIDYLLNSGKALVMFDGLDEIKKENQQRSQAIGELTRFSQKYYQCKIMITCRIAASEYAFPHFQDIEIADFSEAQVHDYVRKWFRNEPLKRDAFFEEFYDKKNKNLQEIANIPLLLSLLCLAFEDNLSFPQRRADLYEEALDALLRRWDVTRNIQRDGIYKNLSLRLKQRLFSHIAADTFEKGEYYIPQRNLEKKIEAYLENIASIDNESNIDGTVILRAIVEQHSIFVERAKGIFTFSHLTFQEYYTAKYIADNEARGTTKELVKKYLTDNRWREVFILTSSLLDEADTFFELFKESIDAILEQENDINNLLIAVEARTKASKLPYDPNSLRALYLLLNILYDSSYAFSNPLVFGRASTLAQILNDDDSYVKGIELLQRQSLMLNSIREIEIEYSSTQRKERELKNQIERRKKPNRDSNLRESLTQTIQQINTLEAQLNSKIKNVLRSTQTLLNAKQHELTPSLGYELCMLFTLQIASVQSFKDFIDSFSLDEYFTDEMLAKVIHTTEFLSIFSRYDRGNDPELSDLFERFQKCLQVKGKIPLNSDLSKEKLELLASYLEANQLLLECLSVSGYVSNKKEIMNSLLSPMSRR